MALKQTKTPVQAYQVNLVCDCEKAGIYQATGRAVQTPTGLQYEHVCTQCKKNLSVTQRQFPTIAYEAIGNAVDIESSIKQETPQSIIPVRTMPPNVKNKKSWKTK